MSAVKNPPSERLSEAALRQSEKFKRCYLWLEKSMPADFFDEIDPDNLMLVTHSLMGFETQDTFSATHLKNGALVVTLDSADADLRILKEYALKGIQNYRTFVSNDSPPFIKQKEKIRVALLHFTGAEAEPSEGLPQELKARVQQLNPSVTDAEFNLLSRSLGARFLRSLPLDRLTVAFDMFFRAQKRDHCQYEVYYNDAGVPSM
ncbi:MAG: glutamate dehydrogenase, partial [Chlamydiia bacterium]|nr:glutamate dehydrogenase [Chlamydiia bacterium]